MKNPVSKKTKNRKVKLSKKIKEKVPSAILHVQSTFNNTIITLSRLNGEVIGQSSAGIIGYKGTRKSTPYAAQLAMNEVLNIVKNYQVQEVTIKLTGIGAGRNSVLRVIESSGLKILSIADVTPIPHNGCRPPKKPRV